MVWKQMILALTRLLPGSCHRPHRLPMKAALEHKQMKEQMTKVVTGRNEST